MAKKAHKHRPTSSSTWLDPLTEEEENSSSDSYHSRPITPFAWHDLTEDDEEDEGGSGGFGWLIDEERVSDLFLGTIAEDISKQHGLHQEQSMPKDSPGGDGAGLSIEKHPLISFNGVDMVIETIQSMTEDERSTYEFSNEYQLRNQSRLSQRLSASSAPKLTR